MTATRRARNKAWDIREGDALSQLKKMPSESVQCVVTSPPYWGLRDYGTSQWQGGDSCCDHQASELRRGVNLAQSAASTRGGAKKIAETGGIPFRDVCGKCGAQREDQQIGLEKTPELYIRKMVRIFRELRRVLRKDGTCWVNMGDSYWGSGKGLNGDGTHSSEHKPSDKQFTNKGSLKTKTGNYKSVGLEIGFKPKDIAGMPWMLALALRADGWWLRQDIIWAKPNPMPESVTDRCTKAHEYIFLLTKSARYFYDAEAIKESCLESDSHPRGGGLNPKALLANQHARMAAPQDPRHANGVGWGYSDGKPRTKATGPNSRQCIDRDPSHLNGVRPKQNESFSGAVNNLVTSRNKRSVWEMATAPFPEAHFATFPPELPEICIKAGTSDRGCCAQCGAPYERVVDKVASTMNVRVRDAANGVLHKKSGGVNGCTATEKEVEDYGSELAGGANTVGWRPSCDCGARSVPCLVLDPFAGAGTTGLVARRLLRNFVGIELNPEYCAMARRRIEQDAPLLNSEGGMLAEVAELQQPMFLTVGAGD